MEAGNKRAVLTALGANLGIAVAKVAETRGDAVVGGQSYPVMPFLATNALLFAGLLKLLLDVVDEVFDLRQRDGALFTGGADAGDDLVVVERLAPAVALHDHRQDLFDPLVGGEALRAGVALAPATDHLAVLGQARVDDLVLAVRAERALHDGVGLAMAVPRETGETQGKGVYRPVHEVCAERRRAMLEA